MVEWVTTPAFTERVNTLMRDFHIPGLSVAVLDGDTVHTRCFGHASIESDTSVDANTIFDIASCSKALTGVAMGILVDNHPKLSKLSWKTPVVELIGDGFVMHRVEDNDEVTVENLLSHTSGFSGRHDMSVLGINAAHPDNVRSVTRNLRHLPSTARPGEKYQYSNIMYAVATHIIETLSGHTFSSFLHENIFKPLSMDTTFLQPSEVYAADLASRFATPFYHENDTYHQATHQEVPEFQGAGSIQTTPSDYIKFIAAMLHHNKSPITQTIYDGVTRPRVMRNSKHSLDDFNPTSSAVAYALGWDIKYRSSQQIVSHDGVITGYGSSMFFLPDRRFGAVFIGNSSAAFGVCQILQSEIIDEFLSTPKEQRFDLSRGQLERQVAQEERKMKKLTRNRERRKQARGTLEVPAEKYCGTFFNAAYRGVTIEMQDGDLYIDAADRSEPFDMVLEHVKDNREFRGYITADDGRGEDGIAVEVRLDEKDDVVAVGFNWDPELGSKYFFWHERTAS
ncbi:beta-lactamase/transpeptidase-like protein [Aureobasidium namibiae CBS 147.97]|uniref:Beta-lactamase/transpeptidase-like protein n=1 Tax=Aureobasidium namibiae CBS 147.97 TaxID=1043004 RepID=A0A074WQ19_9PEZI|nr:beta-lactamase/transpeptidase-like protein [Aureobasidium namibiae CBS 147.97]KEQ75228.1 beta-lactamase/transpeptidase-like protein [Aureobasidium namibiae CBS 147.97]